MKIRGKFGFTPTTNAHPHAKLHVSLSTRGTGGQKDAIWGNGAGRQFSWKVITNKVSKTEFKHAHQRKRLIHRVPGLVTGFDPGLALYFPQCRHHQEYILMVMLPPDMLRTEREVS